MKWYAGGSTPAKGTYFSPGKWEYINVDGQKIFTLPGEPESRYVRLPIWLSLITGPIGGLTLVIFIPLAGIIGLMYYIGTKIKRVFSRPSKKVESKP
ncbi:MAG: hypothetical protein PHE50_08235 [Dehalococcoidales bacterium]|nr:hypothetical protein [Dehalococcoidales bacterium]